MKRSLSIAATTIAAAGLVLVGATGASAHVTVDPSTTEAGSYSVLTFAVPHGCGDSSTTAIAIQIPEELSSATPSVNQGWEIEKVTETLDPPVDDGHGGQLTERVAQIVYTTDTPLPSDYRDAFELSVRLPDLPGETLAFPVVQTCEEGDAPWVELAADGQDGSNLDMPAPVITLTSSDDGADAEPTTDDAEPAADATDEPAGAGQDGTGTDSAATQAADGSGTPAAVSWIALALGAGGLLLGGLALARARRTT